MKTSRSTTARITGLVILALCLVGASAASQTITPDEVERLLIPICPTGGQPGRFGALWQCEMWVRNSADVDVVFANGIPISSLPDGGLIRIRANAIEQYTTSAHRGTIYVVDKEYSDQIHISLRIADVNRRPVSVGTEIPVVRERDWLSHPMELLDIPTEVFVRLTLRVYDPDATQQGAVRLTIYPLTESEPIAETVIEPRGGSDRDLAPTWYRRPDYAEVPDLVAAFPQIAAYPRLRIRLEPLTPEMRYWAFMTITDNLTQQVSVITPQ